MFTYLIIFLSLFGVLAIFVRRSYLVFRKKEEISDKALSQPVVEPQHEQKKRVPRDKKVEMQKLYERAQAHVKKCNPKEAIKTLIKALAIDPDYMDAQKELGRLYLEHQTWGKAAAVYKYLVEKTNDPVDYSHLGLASYNAGELEDAANAYQQAVTLDPQRAPRYVSLAQVYRDLKRDQLALISINKALELDPSNIDYLILAADIQINLNGFVEAQEFLRRVLEISPANKVALKLLNDIEASQKAASLNPPASSI